MWCLARLLLPLMIGNRYQRTMIDENSSQHLSIVDYVFAPTTDENIIEHLKSWFCELYRHCSIILKQHYMITFLTDDNST